LIAGVLRYPDLEQRHQAIFGLGALSALVAYFGNTVIPEAKTDP
jgi:hypothetical protein